MTEKALSVKQPWAQLIVWGIKDIENRTWKTNFRGRVFIHASALISPGHPTKMFTLEQLRMISKNQTHLNQVKNRFFLTGAIVGSVEIVDCVQNHPSIWAEEGCWHWVLANPKIGSEWDGYPVKGSLGLWNMNPDRIMEKLSAQKLEEMVDSIRIDRGNLEHIAKTGVINGTLLTEIWRVIQEGWEIGCSMNEMKNG